MLVRVRTADFVLRNRPFFYLWSAQIVSQTAQNGVFYALMITVERTTGSSLHMSFLILTTVIPTVLFGIVAGVCVDRWSKRTVMVAANLLRAAVSLTFAFCIESPPLLYLLNIAFSTVAQFFAPAEVAVIPALVPRSQIMAANGVFNMTFTVCQMLGFIILAPPLVKLLGLEGFYIVAAVGFVAAAGFVFFLPRLSTASLLQPTDGESVIAGVRRDLEDGLSLLRQSSQVSLAVGELILASSLMLVLGMLAPGYVRRVLSMSPEDAVILFLPVGLGLMCGVAALPRLTRRRSKDQLAEIGLWGIGAGLMALAVASQIWFYLFAIWADAPEAVVAVVGAPLLVALVVLIAGGVGFVYSMLNVAAQTIVHENAPPQMRGRVFATQLAISGGLSILPLVFLGGLADLVGIPWVMALVAIAMFAMAALARSQRKKLGAV